MWQKSTLKQVGQCLAPPQSHQPKFSATCLFGLKKIPINPVADFIFPMRPPASVKIGAQAPHGTIQLDNLVSCLVENVLICYVAYFIL